MAILILILFSHQEEEKLGGLALHEKASSIDLSPLFHGMFLHFIRNISHSRLDSNKVYRLR